MAVYKRDIVDINLETGNIHRTFLNHSIGMKDQKADHFGVRVFRDGEPVNLTGVSVQGVFMPPQGSPIAITSGNIVSENVAEVVLPQACYNYDGQFTLAIKLVDSTNSVTGTVRIIDGMVDNTHASGTVAPTSAVPTYQEVLSAYEQAIAVIGNSVRFDQSQSLTDAQKGTARTNIAAASESELSDVKSALDVTIGTSVIPVTEEYKSINTNGTTVTMVDGVPQASTAYAYNYRLYACLEGDMFVVTGEGGSTSRLYAFVDSTGNVLPGKATASASETNKLIIAPENAAWLIVNSKLASTNYVYKTDNISNRVDYLESFLESNLNDDALAALHIAGIVYENAVSYGFKTDDGTDDTSAIYSWNTGLVDIGLGKEILSCNQYIYKTAFFDVSKTFISTNTDDHENISIPDNTKYVKVQFAKSALPFEDSKKVILFADGVVLLNVHYIPMTYAEEDRKEKTDTLYLKNVDSIFANRVPYGFTSSNGRDNTSATNYWNTGLLDIGTSKTTFTANSYIYKTAFFNAQKVFISTTDNEHTVVSIPQNTKYIKIQFYKGYTPYENFDKLQIFVDGVILASISPDKIGEKTISLDKLAQNVQDMVTESSKNIPGFYDGEQILIRRRLMYKNIGGMYGGQGGCVYNGKLFRFNTDGTFYVYDIETTALVATGTLGGGLQPHCNSADFGNEFYSEDDEYPVVYINAYNATGLPLGTCYVHRIKSDYTTELVQTIQIGFTNSDIWISGSGDTRPYGNFCVDTENNKLYVYVLRDAANQTRFFEFNLPALSAGNVTFTTDDIIRYWDCPYFPYIQDNTYRDGKLYLCTGYGTSDYNGFVRVIDTIREEEISKINLNENSLAFEPEFIGIYNDQLIYGGVYIYRFIFDS